MADKTTKSALSLRRSLILDKDQWKVLEDLAQRLDARATRGPTPGAASWRVLIKEIAKGRYQLVDVDAEQKDDN